MLVFADRARANIEAIPGALAHELRRFVNPLDLATRDDVETQTKLARSRVSFVLNEFLDQQRAHDRALVTELRAELREELQSLAAAIDDDLFTADGAAVAPEGPPRRSRRELDNYLDDFDDDDELDFDDDELDLAGFEPATRRPALDTSDD